MKIRTLVGLLVPFIVGVAAAGLIFVNPMDWSFADRWMARFGSEQRSTVDGAAGMDASGEEREILYWQAPMDPTYIRDEPGLSPMGMELIPVYSDQVSDTGIVEIDPRFVQNMGVRSTPVVRTDIAHTIRAVGTFKYDDSQVYSVNTKYDGWIENVQVNYVGQEVRRGERLFEIFSPQLVNAQQEYLNALDYLDRLSESSNTDARERARGLVAAARQRLRYWDFTDDQIDELIEAGEPARSVSVVSRVDGIVVSKMDQSLEGMMARPGMNLYTIADLSTIWVEAEVYESDIPWLRVGQDARIEIPSQPGTEYRGRIRYIFPFLDRTTRTLRLSIELPNPGSLRAEMYANVFLEVPAATSVAAIPEEAVLRSGTRDVVVVDLGAGRFAVREVALGLHGDGVWEVRRGLEPGERVVVSAQFLIDSESNLQEAIRKLNAAPEADTIDRMEIEGMEMGLPGTDAATGSVTAPIPAGGEPDPPMNHDH